MGIVRRQLGIPPIFLRAIVYSEEHSAGRYRCCQGFRKKAIVEDVNAERTPEFRSVSVKISDKDAPTYPVNDCDGPHEMSRGQRRGQRDIEVRDEIIVLFVPLPYLTITTGSSL